MSLTPFESPWRYRSKPPAYPSTGSNSTTRLRKAEADHRHCRPPNHHALHVRPPPRLPLLRTTGPVPRFIRSSHRYPALTSSTRLLEARGRRFASTGAGVRSANMRTPNTRLTRLLVRGFNPRELPRRSTSASSHGCATLSRPPTTTRQASRFSRARTTAETPATSASSTRSATCFSRASSQSIAPIKNAYALTSSSGTVPRFPPLCAPGRAHVGQPLTDLRAIQHRIASTSPLVVRLDISNFCGSIYKHSVPWAVLRKQAAKTLYKRRNSSPLEQRPRRPGPKLQTKGRP